MGQVLLKILHDQNIYIQCHEHYQTIHLKYPKYLYLKVLL